jgi:hypothetical protein
VCRSCALGVTITIQATLRNLQIVELGDQRPVVQRVADAVAEYFSSLDGQAWCEQAFVHASRDGAAPEAREARAVALRTDADAG